MSNRISRLPWLACAGGLLVLMGCNQATESKAKEEKTAASTCADYAKKVCDEAGAESQTCASVKTATELMPPAACAAADKEFAFTKDKLAAARKSCDELSSKLCGDLGAETETCKMVKERTKEFPPERCSTMMQHYAEVLADLKKQEARNQPLPADKVAAIAKSDAPAFGPENAAVTIVEFSDFQCPFCSRAANVAQKLKGQYGDRVRFVFRQFPLSFHKEAHLAAQASLAAHAQGKFWEYHDKLFADQNKLQRADLEATAKAVGLNVAEFKKALDDKTYAATVDADLKLGEDVQVDGTPTMFLNGKRIPNPTDYDAVAKMIDEALAKKPS